jgi:GxxExxY protein
VQINEITREIIGASIRVHSALGPGLLESTYRACLCRELEINGMRCQTELALPIIYRGLTIQTGYRIDLLVEDVVIVETKAVAKLSEVHDAQLLSYLRLSRRTVGLLINFHVRHLRHGIKRMVNNYTGARVRNLG